MEFDDEVNGFYYPCPCGDKFFITLKDLYLNKETAETRDKCIAICPSCSL